MSNHKYISYFRTRDMSEAVGSIPRAGRKKKTQLNEII
jgi:hypothetical protein